MTVRRARHGGAMLGVGGMGAIFTLDDLRSVIRSGEAASLVTLWFDNPSKDIVQNKTIDIDQFANKYETRLVFKAAIDAASSSSRVRRGAPRWVSSSSPTTDRAWWETRRPSSSVDSESQTNCTEELRGNLRMLLAMAKKANPKAAAIIDRASPFYREKGRNVFIVGLMVWDARTGEIKYGLPLYRRMEGDLISFYRKMGHTIAIHHVLDIIRNTLHMIKVMQGIRASHVDIKEDNILYGISCDVEGLRPKERLSAVMKRSGRCAAAFKLSDYGLVITETDRHHKPTMRGTPGYVSPARYMAAGHPYEKFKRDFAGILPIAPLQIWKSYDRKAVAMRASESMRFVLEKSDLYALGVVLYAFDSGQDDIDPLLRFAQRLIFGDEFRDLWTIDDALAAYGEMRGKFHRDSNVVVSVNPSSF